MWFYGARLCVRFDIPHNSHTEIHHRNIICCNILLSDSYISFVVVCESVCVYGNAYTELDMFNLNKPIDRFTCDTLTLSWLNAYTYDAVCEPQILDLAYFVYSDLLKASSLNLWVRLQLPATAESLMSSIVTRRFITLFIRPRNELYKRSNQVW